MDVVVVCRCVVMIMVVLVVVVVVAMTCALFTCFSFQTHGQKRHTHSFTHKLYVHFYLHTHFFFSLYCKLLHNICGSNKKNKIWEKETMTQIATLFCERVKKRYVNYGSLLQSTIPRHSRILNQFPSEKLLEHFFSVLLSLNWMDDERRR